MFPGYTTKISEQGLSLATTIYPKSDLIRVTSTATTTVVATISPTFMGGFSGILVIANRSGAGITTVTTGNILTAVTIPVDTAIVMVFSRAEGKWIPGALA